ncbi:MBL fold metallo-hydrolase [Shewanella goraebulensis]|uniref:MBL fold metallo-hydrolase n=1 Tax=Shewanella goraebulensis TaxID=3050637 RepID=UPI00254B82D1|nr:MBL fold metallo-hydrolase [Shewanella goraebulensis]
MRSSIKDFTPIRQAWLTLVLLMVLVFITSGCSAQSSIHLSDTEQTQPAKPISIFNGHTWAHGALDCNADNQPAHEVYQYDPNSYIVRQNKCLTYEAPFIYILVGENKVLILDTGALNRDADFSFYEEIQTVLGSNMIANKELIIVHSHGHSDHYQGDKSFEGEKNTHLVMPSSSAVQQFYQFDKWPQGQFTIALGGRDITVFPTPGHQEEALTFYDDKNKWLLTGDTLYPGYIYVKNWDEYRSSIARLTQFAESHEVSAILGAHIEMKAQLGEYYPIGSTYQPNEANLDLTVKNLQQLNTILQSLDEPTEVTMDHFIIKPMSGFQKAISNAARWFTQ